MGELQVLHPHGGRIIWIRNKEADEIWDALRATASTELNKDTRLQDQLERAGIWLFPETKKERSRIEYQIRWLEKQALSVEAEWSDRVWKTIFLSAQEVTRSFNDTTGGCSFGVAGISA